MLCVNRPGGGRCLTISRRLCAPRHAACLRHRHPWRSDHYAGCDQKSCSHVRSQTTSFRKTFSADLPCLNKNKLTPKFPGTAIRAADHPQLPSHATSPGNRITGCQGGVISFHSMMHFPLRIDVTTISLPVSKPLAVPLGSPIQLRSIAAAKTMRSGLGRE